jgi:hypothetical protein
MSDPRNDAHDKKVTQEKKKHEAAAEVEPSDTVETGVVSEVITAQPSAALEGSLAVLAALKDLEFHSRANLQRLATLALTVEDELKQKDLAGQLNEVYSAQNNVQASLTTLIEAYKTECDRLQA